MTKKFKPGDRAFAMSGQMLQVHSVVAKGYLVQDVMFEVEDEDEQFLEDTVYFIEKLYKNPPMHVMNQKHEQLQKDIERFTNERTTIKEDIYNLQSQKNDLLNSLPYDDKHNILGRFINGELEYYVTSEKIAKVDDNVRFALRFNDGKVKIDYLSENGFGRDTVFAVSLEVAMGKMWDMISSRLSKLCQENNYDFRHYTQIQEIITRNKLGETPFYVAQQLEEYKARIDEKGKKNLYESIANNLKALQNAGITADEAIKNVREYTQGK